MKMWYADTCYPEKEMQWECSVPAGEEKILACLSVH